MQLGCWLGVVVRQENKKSGKASRGGGEDGIGTEPFKDWEPFAPTPCSPNLALRASASPFSVTSYHSSRWGFPSFPYHAFFSQGVVPSDGKMPPILVWLTPNDPLDSL